MLQAMIDIGSNTIRMAIYEIRDGHAAQVMKRKHTVGLAAYVRDGVMQRDGIERAGEVIAEYRDFLFGLGISRMVAFTTAALRNAKNGGEAVAELERRTGVSIRVISGEEEAAFDFAGATHDLSAEDGALLDIGGGSTEVVLYRGRRVTEKRSLPFGSLSLRAAHVRGLLPDRAEAEAIRTEAEAAVRAAFFDAAGGAPEAVGIGGTFKGAAALYRATYCRPEGDARMETARFGEMIARYAGDAPLSEEAAVRLMLAAPDRIHTLFSGLILADVLTRALGCREVVYSDSGVREGYLYSEILKR